MIDKLEVCPKCNEDVSGVVLRDDKGHLVCPDCGARLCQPIEEWIDRLEIKGKEESSK